MRRAGAGRDGSARIAALAMFAATAGALIVACSTTPKADAGLELIVEADGLSAPTNFDHIELEISQQGSGGWDKIWDDAYLVPSHEATLPAAFTLLAGPGAREVLISVTAFLGAVPVVQRVAQVQVPTDRLADLWLILAMVCEGTVSLTGAEAEPKSTCSPGESCQPTGALAGQCGSNVIPIDTLPDYVPGQDLDAGPGASDATMTRRPRDAGPADATTAGEGSGALDASGGDAGGIGSGRDGAPACTPATCASLGYNCGLAVDGCGGTIGPCGSCVAPLACGANKPNVCGINVPCTGLCQQQAACDGGTTTITGTVRGGLQEGAASWVPAGVTPDPVPSALVYIPNGPVEPFDSDPSHPLVQCTPCGANVSGSPLVSTMTGIDGTFTLANVPVSKSAATGDKIPIVVQVGKWRRQFAFTIANSCGANRVGDLNLPSTSTEGDIPLTAISTGSYDPIECLLLKMGVAQTEFTSYATWSAETASGTTPKPGRVHIYTGPVPSGGNAQPGSSVAPIEDETVLLGTGATGGAANGTFMMYDQILLPCWGDAVTKNGAELSNLGYYGDHGGRFFGSHYAYSWLNGNNGSNLTSVAQWDPKANTNVAPPPNGVVFTGNVSSTVPVTVPPSNPGTFVRWLNYVSALTNSNPGGAPPVPATVPITSGRHDVDKVLGQSIDWIDGTDPSPPSSARAPMLLHFTFDMPVGQSSQCGRGIYSDFDVVSAGQSANTTFPSECDATALTRQERIMEYQLWNLASCLPPPPMSTCTPKSCADLRQGCGPAADGCGNLIAGGCGSCPTDQACGGGGTPGQCGAP